jgi:hypothetical protein
MSSKDSRRKTAIHVTSLEAQSRTIIKRSPMRATWVTCELNFLERPKTPTKEMQDLVGVRPTEKGRTAEVLRFKFKATAQRESNENPDQGVGT